MRAKSVWFSFFYALDLKIASLVSFLEEIEPRICLDLSDNFQLWSYPWLQCDAVYRFSFAFVSHGCIDLSGFHVLVSQHVLDCIDACTSIHL